MIIVNTKLPKLCFAKPGDVVRLTNDQFEPEPTLYLIAVMNVKGKRPARVGVSHGLYDEQRPLFLVNLENGEAIEMPHLSSRVEIVRDAALVVRGEGNV